LKNQLLKAIQIFDTAFDKSYFDSLFTAETKRFEFLFELYDIYTGGMFPED